MTAKRPSTDAAAAPQPPQLKIPAGSKRSLIACGVVAMLAIVLVVVLWNRVRAHVLAGANYVVDPQKVTMTPLPDWIHIDFRDELIHEASLSGPVSLMDPELTVRIANLAKAHPWVESVIRVSKQYPSSVDVELTYRRPVAMVKVAKGALPIDAHSVMLPDGDFVAADGSARPECLNYPLVDQIHSQPPDYAGMTWDDSAVRGAVSLAELLLADWSKWGLRSIQPTELRRARVGAEYIYTLTTRGDTTIEWGRAPSSDLPGELPAERKLMEIQKLIAREGSLDAGGPRQLVFSETGELVARTQPNIRPLPRK